VDNEERKGGVTEESMMGAGIGEVKAAIRDIQEGRG